MSTQQLDPEAKTLHGTLVAEKYEILSAMASGGMGTVYRARHLQLDRDVAIKLMHARHFDNREYMARFRQEAQKAAGLEHPGIVEVRDFGEDPALGPYLEMEMLEGFSLRELLQAVGPLPIEVVVHCIAECLDALHYAHSRGILHRDLKPANLFVAREGDHFQTKILDFGLAKTILDDNSGSGQETLTKTGIVLGTLTYMSPEHFADFKSVDQRADIYSLSASAFELLTGRPVVSGTSFIQCVDKVSRGLHRQHPAEMRPAIPPELDEVIARGLRQNRDDRYADAGAMRDAILKCVRDPGEAQRTLRRLIVVEDALSKPRYRPPSGEQEDAFDQGFEQGLEDDDPTTLGRPVFDDDDAPTTISTAPRVIAESSVLVEPMADDPLATMPLAGSTLAPSAMSSRPGARRRRKGTLWGAPLWFWASALGLVIVLTSIVIARRPRAAPEPQAPDAANAAGALGSEGQPEDVAANDSRGAHGHPVGLQDVDAASDAAQGDPNFDGANDADPEDGVGSVESGSQPVDPDPDPPEGAEDPDRAIRPAGSEGAGTTRTIRAPRAGSTTSTAVEETSPERASRRTTLDINTIPSSRVFLDGVDTGRRTPVRGLSVSPGRHVVELRVGSASHRYPVIASEGESVRLFRVLPTE